jgi:TRAP-type C4-dicarboxylate transport system permease small subunit
MAVSRVIVRAVNRVFLTISGLLVLIVVAIVLQDVVRRYGFNDPSEWALDISSFLLVYIFFLALAPALEAGSHVTVDFLGERLPASWQGYAAVLANALVAAFGAVLLWQLLDRTIEVFAENYLSSTALPIRLKYIYVIAPIGAFQFVVTALVRLLDALGDLSSNRVRG